MVKKKQKSKDNIKTIKIVYNVDTSQLKAALKLLQRVKKLIPKYAKLH